MNEIERAARECWLREGNTRDEVDELVRRCKQDEWVSVEDRLPKDCTNVLFFYHIGSNGQKGIGYGFINKKMWHVSYLNNALWFKGSDNPVTHWMPLPEPPK